MTYTGAHSLPTLPATLDRLGLPIASLGCVMLDLAPFIPDDLIPAEMLYSSTHPDRSWIAGAVGAHGAHVTLKYGLHPDVTRDDVDGVLTGWQQPDVVPLSDLEHFPSPFEDEPYVCIVALVDMEDLREGYLRLSALPHVDTYPAYRAHATVAYVHAERAHEAAAIIDSFLDEHGEYVDVHPELNYGDVIGGTSA